MLFWLKLGFISFGGPAGQIAIMHQELVERRRWISERRFLHALNYCMLLPGPEAQQLATYIGWLMHRTWGGVIAGTLFVLPSLFILIGLSWVYLAWGEVPVVAGSFLRDQAGRDRHRRACRPPHWHARPEKRLVVGHCRGLVRGHFRARRSLPADRAGGRAARPCRRAAATGAVRAWWWPRRNQSQPWPGRDRRRHTGARARPLQLGAAAGPTAGGCRAVAAAHGCTDGYLWLARHLDANGLVLHQGGIADLRWRLRGAALRLPGGRRPLRLAVADADDRWSGVGGNHPRAADHGGGLRRLRRWLPAPHVRHRPGVHGRRGSSEPGDLVHLPALVPVHPGRWPAGGIDPQRTQIHRPADRDNRGGSGRDPQPRAVLRLPRIVAGRFRRAVRLAFGADCAGGGGGAVPLQAWGDPGVDSLCPGGACHPSVEPTVGAALCCEDARMAGGNLSAILTSSQHKAAPTEGSDRSQGLSPIQRR
ncbi:chromate transporter [Pseudomonas putida S11]|nr:chromate transporter [Pseudomonas putida S11]